MPWPSHDEAIDGRNLPRHCGLGDLDRAIWQEAIIRGLIQPIRVWCNQHVGVTSRTPGPEDAPWLASWINAAYRKRPDMLLVDNAGNWVVEIKPWASYVALGQALVYTDAARRMAGSDNSWNPMILTDYADPDLRPCAERLGVRLEILGQPIAPRPPYAT